MAEAGVGLLVSTQQEDCDMEEEQSFELTALPHLPGLRNYALYLTMNDENAKDLVQETFLKAYRFWHKFEQGTNVRAWLYRIMKNSFLNNYRTQSKESNNVEYDENRFCHTAIHRESFDLTPVKKKDCEELFGDEIAHSIESLPSAFKTVLILRDVEDFSYSEIAQVVQCPVGTVRSRLHRGRNVLQKQLSGYARDNGYVQRKK